MGFNCGIIGLPNVGKSTIFNALSNAGALVANYPFCTIEPNRGIVAVPDDRLLQIARLLHKNDPIHTRIEFIDLAGLVKGASKGEGLGNRFLSHIREVDALVHVVRCFHRDDVVHVAGEVDPVRDVEIVNTEILLADLETLQRAEEKTLKLLRMGDKDSRHDAEPIKGAIEYLNRGSFLKDIPLHEEERAVLRSLGLISMKPVLYCANIDEGAASDEAVRALAGWASSQNAEFIAIMGKLEGEIEELPPGEREQFIKEMGIEQSGLLRLIRVSYRLLDLITYYTAATDLQAWTLKSGTRAVDAAGKIHSDFEKGFIRAEVYTFADLLEAGSEHHVREAGKLRYEGKDYVIQDGDIVRYLFHN